MIISQPKDIEVFCLSQNNNNTLMWSHYADSHKGICIEYKIHSLPPSVGWGMVNYVPENYDYKRASKNNGLISAGFYTKHENWFYEKEIRLAMFKSKNNKIEYIHTQEIGEKNNKICAYISEITLGYKFDLSNIPIIKSVINELNSRYNDIPNIVIYKTIPDDDFPFKLKKIKI